MWKSFHWKDTMEEGAQRGNQRNSQKLNSFRVHSCERGDGQRGLNLNISSLSCFEPIVIAWRSPFLHRKEWIWHQRSQTDNARKPVWMYVNTSVCPRFPRSLWRGARRPQPGCVEESCRHSYLQRHSVICGRRFLHNSQGQPCDVRLHLSISRWPLVHTHPLLWSGWMISVGGQIRCLLWGTLTWDHTAMGCGLGVCQSP